MRSLLRHFVAIYLLLTGKRFSSGHRHNESALYRLFSTTQANLIADKIYYAIFKKFPKDDNLDDVIWFDQKERSEYLQEMSQI